MPSSWEPGHVRWRLLLLSCLMCVGTNFIYDFPGSIGVGSLHSIQERFLERGTAYSEAMNQGLYAAYSFPNSVLILLGGLLIDQVLGLRHATVLFGCVALVGAVTFYLGVLYVQYAALVCGRVLLGCGCECLGIAQSGWNTKWFSGRFGLPAAFALSMAFQRLGGALNFLFSDQIADTFGVIWAAAAGAIAVASSLLLAILVALVDRWCEKTARLALDHVPQRLTKKVEFDQVRQLPLRLWLLALVCGGLYTALLSFLGFAVPCFEVRFGQSSVVANTQVSVYMFVVAAVSPVVGLTASSFGSRHRRTLPLLLCVGCAGITGCLAAIAAVPGVWSPLPFVVIAAVCFCAVGASLFPSVPTVVPPARLGTAFGALTAVIALTGASMRLIVGAVLDTYTAEGAVLPSEQGFTVLLWSLTGVAALAVGAAVSFLVTAPRSETIQGEGPSGHAPPTLASARHSSRRVNDGAVGPVEGSFADESAVQSRAILAHEDEASPLITTSFRGEL